MPRVPYFVGFVRQQIKLLPFCELESSFGTQAWSFISTQPENDRFCALNQAVSRAYYITLDLNDPAE
jgi:hypothetical protein